MRWLNIKINPLYWNDDNFHFLVSDGEKIYLVFRDHDELIFLEDHYENWYEIESRITHFGYIDDIELPKEKE